MRDVPVADHTATAATAAPRSAAAVAGWWGGLLASQPGADDLVQRVGVDAGQHAALGRLPWWPEGAGQGMTAHPEGARIGPGASAAHSPIGASDLAPASTAQTVTPSTATSGSPSAASVPGVGDRGEVVEQAVALVGGQSGGRGQPLGDRGDGG